jgi:ligand-binding sensor domain-containing protein/AraC-like DNA-binding protein
MARKTVLLLVLSGCFFVQQTIAQQYSFRSISVEDGLANNLVKCIYKDKVGFVWIGTLEGLDRFDGVEIKSYTKTVFGNRISVNALCEDPKGCLWIGTETSLYKFDKLTESGAKINLDAVSVKVLALHNGTNNTLYVGTNNGLYLYNRNNGEIKHFPLGEKLHLVSVTGFAGDTLGNLWLSTSSGLVCFSPANNSLVHYYCSGNTDEACNTFTGISMVGDNIYLGTKVRGLMVFNRSSKKINPFGSIGNDLILSVSGDGKDRVFAGTDGGGLKVIEVKNKLVETIMHDDDDPYSITSNAVYSFLCDDRNTFWVGTFSAGLSYSQNFSRKFKSFPVFAKYRSQNKSIRSLYFDADGTKFIGTRDGFLYVNKQPERLYSFRSGSDVSTTLRSNIILSLFPYKDKLLVGTYGGGISVFDKKTNKFAVFLDIPDFRKGCIYGFTTDNTGCLWIATLNGIFKYNSVSKQLDHFTAENSGLRSNEVFSLKIDSKGRIWVGTMNGFCLFDPAQRKCLPNAIPKAVNNSYKTTFIFEDSKHNIWFCTETGGLFCFDNSLTHFSNFTINDGLPDNSVCAIAESKTGDLWISTLKGFCRFSPGLNKFRNYNLVDGLPGLAFNPAACYITPSGQMWWGNEKGLVFFHPDSLSDNGYVPPIKIIGLFISGKEIIKGGQPPLTQSVETTSEIYLSNRQNNISFRFVALNYTNPLDNQYACKLEGYDNNWRSLGNQNRVNYGGLPSGKYLFKVRLMSSDDTKAENSCQITVIVKPSFFKTPYFILLLLTIVGIGVWLRGIYLGMVRKNKVVPKIDEVHDKYKGSKVPEDVGIAIQNALLTYMTDKKPFLNPDLKLADLAEEIGYSVHEISQVLNQYINQNFADFVNNYRVEEVKIRVMDKSYAKFTLIAIAQQCGFNSKTSFFRVFKKNTGKTPADFFRDSKENAS